MKQIPGVVIIVLVVALAFGTLAFVRYREGVEEQERRRDTCEGMRDLEQAVAGYSDDRC